MSLLNKASLIQIPSGYKDGTLYSAKPTNGDGDFTFSRGSNLAATRVKDGLIEKGRENLLLQSNQFDTTWTTSNASVTGGQSGYDGSSDAWLLQASGTFAFVRQLGLSVNGVATASVYLKAGTTDWVNFRLSASANNQIYVNLSNGTFGTISASNLVDKSIEDVGGGWYRVSVVLNVSSLTGFYIYVADGDNTLNTTNETIYIQSAQLEVGLISTPYIETGASTAQAGILEDMPRLDYSGDCPSCLLEPQRSNLVTNSEYVSSSDYVTGNWSGTITTNTSETLSPQGLYNATKFVKSGSTDRVYFQTSVSDGTYTGSMYFKAVSGQEGNTIEISVRRFGGGSGSTTKLITLSSEWQRVDVTATLSGGSNTAIYIADFSSSGNASSFYFYGAMLEAGSYATSYIPTYGASVTRGADSCTNADVSSLLGSGVGTAFIDMVVNGQDTQGNIPLTIGTGTSNLIYLWIQTSQTIRYEAYTGGTLEGAVNTASGFYTYGDKIKVALVWADNDFAMYINGTLIGTDTSGTAPTPTKLWLGEYTSGNYKGGSINQVTLFPTRLSNDELEQLTTL